MSSIDRPDRLQEGLHESRSLIELQKEDAVEALSTLAAPCKHVPDMLDTLQALGVPFSIATTLGKPRVPVRYPLPERPPPLPGGPPATANRRSP